MEQVIEQLRPLLTKQKNDEEKLNTIDLLEQFMGHMRHTVKNAATQEEKVLTEFKLPLKRSRITRKKVMIRSQINQARDIINRLKKGVIEYDLPANNKKTEEKNDDNSITTSSEKDKTQKNSKTPFIEEQIKVNMENLTFIPLSNMELKDGIMRLTDNNEIEGMLPDNNTQLRFIFDAMLKQQFVQPKQPEFLQEKQQQNPPLRSVKKDQQVFKSGLTNSQQPSRKFIFGEPKNKFVFK